MIIKIRELIRELVINIRYLYLTKLYKMNIDKTAKISLGAKLDKTHPKGIFIGEESYVASGGIIFTHDYSRNFKTNTIIGKSVLLGQMLLLCLE
jgi:acetyltransferase-like isoleucine patch superfamily enzyme